MVYQVRLDRQAEKDLRSLPHAVAAKTMAALRALAEDPHPIGCRKLVGSANDWRIRIGDYRVLYEILNGLGEIHIHRIRHRKDVYR